MCGFASGVYFWVPCNAVNHLPSGREREKGLCTVRNRARAGSTWEKDRRDQSDERDGDGQRSGGPFVPYVLALLSGLTHRRLPCHTHPYFYPGKIYIGPCGSSFGRTRHITRSYGTFVSVRSPIPAHSGPTPARFPFAREKSISDPLPFPTIHAPPPPHSHTPTLTHLHSPLSPHWSPTAHRSTIRRANVIAPIGTDHELD